MSGLQFGGGNFGTIHQRETRRQPTQTGTQPRRHSNSRLNALRRATKVGDGLLRGLVR